MPELPEVETVCRGLTPYVVGAQIEDIDLRRPNLRFDFPKGFTQKLKGARVTHIERRAKFILKHLDNGLVWITHLGMTGRYTVHPVSAAQGAAQGNGMRNGNDRHDHVLAQLSTGTRLVYTDPRRFGYMDLLPANELESCQHFSHLGPEPLGNHFDERVLAKAFENKQTPVKNALLDQRVVAGLGNIYVCEALFRAGISPRRKAANIGDKRLARLVPHIRDVLTEAIAAGGSSLRDFAGAEGSAGYFQHHFNVYDREGEVCSNQQCNASVRRIVQSGRSSFFCPSCQK